MSYLPRRLEGALVLLISLRIATAKVAAGSVSLGARSGKVVTKFCFDFNPSCSSEKCGQQDYPGINQFQIYNMKRSDGLSPEGGLEPDVYIVMLDDEYFSFPEVSQVWNEATCVDLKKAGKTTLKVDWNSARTEGGQMIHNQLTERLRPRWWYLAFVSCSDFPLQLTYNLHLTNQLKGAQKEFSMDYQDVIYYTYGLAALLGLVSYVQYQSSREWSARSRGALHPAVGMVNCAVFFALAGMVVWVLYYREMQASGVCNTTYDMLARGCIMCAKVVMQILFQLQAYGHGVCSSELSLSEHKELAYGMVAFGFFSFVLEVWSDTEFWSTSTEYVYDTRPGIALVAVDCFWLWMFVSRSWQTRARETRVKARAFYNLYAPLWALWFLALPGVAFVARALSPWVRYRIVFVSSGFAHALALALVVYTFQPKIAVRIYDLKLSEYEPVLCGEEVEGMLGASLGVPKLAHASDFDDDCL